MLEENGKSLKCHLKSLGDLLFYSKIFKYNLSAEWMTCKSQHKNNTFIVGFQTEGEYEIPSSSVCVSKAWMSWEKEYKKGKTVQEANLFTGSTSFSHK